MHHLNDIVNYPAIPTSRDPKFDHVSFPRLPKCQWPYTSYWIFFAALAGTAFGRPLALQIIPDPQNVETTVRYSPYFIKCIEAGIALLAAALVTLTYSIVIDTGTRMTNTSMLPMEPIRQNISSILSSTWATNSACQSVRDVDAKEFEDSATPTDTIMLFYVGRMRDDGGRVARGVLQCEAKPDEPRPTPRLWLAAGSPLTTSIVQIAIWEWVFLWIGLAMIVVTVLHNGFAVGPRAQDAFLRLSVVLAYSAANIGHAVYVWRACVTFFTNVAAGAAWSMLSRSSFAVVDTVQLRQRLSDPSPNAPLDFHMIERANDAFTPSTFPARLEHEPQHQKETEISTVGATSPTTPRQHPDADRELKTAVDSLSGVQKTEREKATIAGNLALDRVIASGMLTLAVNISCGFLAWSNATGADETLGSLGLLGSLSLGMASMYTSAVQLNILNSSFKEILYLKEIKINGQALTFAKKRPSPRRVIGLAQGDTMPSRVGIRDVVGALSVKDVFCLLLFGPAYFLLPTEHDRDRTSMRTEFELRMSVRGHPIVFTTAGTNMHDRGSDGSNLEAVNVCYLRPE